MAVTALRIAYLSSYFDSLVDKVPVRNYLDPDEVLDLRSMKRKERQEAKNAFKTQHKLSKRAKLDPDGEAHTTAAQTRQEAEEQRFRDNLLSQDHGKPSGADPGALRERLAAKVQALREQRNADVRKQGVEKATAWRERQHVAAMHSSQEMLQESRRRVIPPSTPQTTAVPNDVMFNKLQFMDPAERPAANKKQSKAGLLKQAQTKASEEGREQESVDAWTKMMKLAKGEKVLDDPKLLKRSLKRMNKEKQKSKEGWKVRMDAVHKKQADKQEKRRSNLQKKVDQKKEKKQAKREKRFLGAGFEGRTTALRQ